MEQEQDNSVFFSKWNSCAFEASRNSPNVRQSARFDARQHPHNAHSHDCSSCPVRNDARDRSDNRSTTGRPLSDEKALTVTTCSYTFRTDDIGSDKFDHRRKISERVDASRHTYTFDSASCSGTQENRVPEQPMLTREPLDATQSREGDTEEDSPDLDDDSEGSPPVPLSLPVVIEFEDERISSLRLDLKLVEEVIRNTAGDGVESVKPTSAGRFVVTVCKTDAAVKLQLMTNLLGARVDVMLSTWYRKNIAKMHFVPLYMTNNKILEALAPYGVIGARRSANYTRLADGSCIEMPKSIILLTFSPEMTELPSSLPIGENMYEIERCSSHPVQCSNCFRFLHYGHQCKAPTRCKLCAGNHPYRVCNNFSAARCANCHGPHPATYSMCPTKLKFLKAPGPAKGRRASALDSSWST